MASHVLELVTWLKSEGWTHRAQLRYNQITPAERALVKASM